MLPIIVVVCDDTKTAVAYFNELKHEVKERKIVNVYPAPYKGATGDDLIEFAKEKATRVTEPDDYVCALVDLDTNPDESRLKRAAASSSVTLLLSNPCYEVWTLAHLQDTGEYFLNCNAVLSRTKAKWKELFGAEFGNKAQADYEKLRALRDSAISRCERRNPATNQSWTEVWQAVKVIIH